MGFIFLCMQKPTPMALSNSSPQLSAAKIETSLGDSYKSSTGPLLALFCSIWTIWRHFPFEKHLRPHGEISEVIEYPGFERASNAM